MTPTNVATGDLVASENDPADDAAPSPDEPEAPNFNNETLKRILAALVMAPLGVWVVFAGGVALKIATAICALLAAIEWFRMTRRDEQVNFSRILPLFVLILGGVSAVYAGGIDLQWVIAVSATSILFSALVGVVSNGKTASLAFGALYVSLPFGAFIFVREVASGAWLLLSVMALVWATDIAAFLAGRGFGGPQLSPRNSPNKTWTGALGALICTVLAGVVIARLIRADIVTWVILAAMVSVLAQAGDLLESAFKRRFGVKDTSGIIPGHGGVLDRLDSLMAVVSALGLAVYLFPEILNLLEGRSAL